MARAKNTPEKEDLEVSFEDALANLESIVEAMENERLPLEDLVARYEEGSILLNRCEAILKAARGRIELITLRNQNEIGLESSARTGQSAELPPEPNGLPGDPDDDDDIRLF